MLKLLRKTSIILVMALIFSIGIDMAYRQAYRLPYQWPKNIWIHPEIDEKYQLVKVGNSHAQDGIVFDHFNLKSLSLSSVAQSFEYDLATLKMYSRQIAPEAIVIINVSPISFSQIKQSKQDSLQYTYYDGRLSPFLIPNLKAGDYIQSQIVPFTRAVYLWREAYAKKTKEQAQKTFADAWKMPEIRPTIREHKENNTILSSDLPDTEKKTVNPMPSQNKGANNPTSDKKTSPKLIGVPQESQDRLSDSVQFMVHKWYHTKDFGTQYFEANGKDLEDLIQYCLSKNWRPVLITIPISQALLDGLGGDFMQKYVYDPLKNVDTQGVEYIDFSTNQELVQNGYFFSNSDHLNNNGALFLSDMLLDRLIDRGYIMKENDGRK